MNQMDGTCKVGDELGASYEEEDCYYSKGNVSYWFVTQLLLCQFRSRESIYTKAIYFKQRKEKGRTSRQGEGRSPYPINEFSSHTKPSIHPTVVSPLRLRQLNTRFSEKCPPATSVVKSIRPVATPYHMDCNITICLRIFKGGSSVSAPGRGGRRRRAIPYLGSFVCMVDDFKGGKLFRSHGLRSLDFGWWM